MKLKNLAAAYVVVAFIPRLLSDTPRPWYVCSEDGLIAVPVDPGRGPPSAQTVLQRGHQLAFTTQRQVGAGVCAVFCNRGKSIIQRHDLQKNDPTSLVRAWTEKHCRD